jgi:regulator of protease activity HflC (stomatin/prohibitin superfamily)
MVVDLLLGAGGIVALWAVAGLRVVRQFERGVVFRFGRVQSEVRPPGLTRVHPGVDQVPPGEHADRHHAGARAGRDHRDNVTVKVDAVVYFKVIDPVRAIVDVQDYRRRSGRSRRPRCGRSSARATSTTCCPTASGSTRASS